MASTAAPPGTPVSRNIWSQKLWLPVHHKPEPGKRLKKPRPRIGASTSFTPSWAQVVRRAPSSNPMNPSAVLARCAASGRRVRVTSRRNTGTRWYASIAAAAMNEGDRSRSPLQKPSPMQEPNEPNGRRQPAAPPRENVNPTVITPRAHGAHPRHRRLPNPEAHATPRKAMRIATSTLTAFVALKSADRVVQLDRAVPITAKGRASVVAKPPAVKAHSRRFKSRRPLTKNTVSHPETA